jgi:hypothetical protein
LVLWNYPHPNSSGISSFNAFTSDSSTFSTSTFVGVFAPNDNGNALGALGNAAQVFDLLDTDARYLRIEVTNTFRNNGVGLSEIAFDIGSVTAAVPEPGSLALFGAALGAFGLSRRRKNA